MGGKTAERTALSPPESARGAQTAGESGRGLSVVRRQAAAALGIYACHSLLVYGHQVIGHLSHTVVRSGQLPFFYGRDQSA
jgi:hypothetical protein